MSSEAALVSLRNIVKGYRRGQQTLLFVHGLASGYKGWNKVVGQLRQQYRCIALDLPGYGSSGKVSHPVSIGFFASRLNEFVEKLQT